MDILYLSPKDDLQNILDNIACPTTIYLKNGIYGQKICIRCNNVEIIGEDQEKTIICWDDYAKKPNVDGREYNTFRTYTVCVVGENVKMKNLTVKNNNKIPEVVGQCVALSVNSKSFLAEDVTLISTQDTLFTSPFPDDLIIRYSGLTDDPTYYDGFIPKDQLYLEGNSVQLFEHCKIMGTVDFIFGCAEAYFKDCTLISLDDKRKCGYVAAPAHSLKQERGYSFIDCTFKNGGAGDGEVYLARPWRDFGKCDFINCTLEDHINPDLFDKWNDTFRDKTARFNYYNLQSSHSLSPVTWSHELSRGKVEDIMAAYNAARAKWYK